MYTRITTNFKIQIHVILHEVFMKQPFFMYKIGFFNEK